MADKSDQKGPAASPEDKHGAKAHNAFIDSLHGRHGGSEESEGAPQEGAAGRGSPYGENSSDGKHRLQENRQQHDPAEKNSEADRAQRMGGETPDSKGG
jgi:hypothetical protein